MKGFNKVLILFFFGGILLLPALAIAEGISLVNPINAQTFPELFTAILKTAGGIILALGAFMIVVSGFLFMTSAGNPGKVGQARAAFLYAIIGIIVGGLAEAIAGIITTAVMK